MDRLHELESRRWSLAMLPPRAPGLEREEAMALLGELEETERRLKRLREGLTKLLEEDEQDARRPLNQAADSG